MLEFGDRSIPWTDEYPKEKDLLKMKTNTRLTAIDFVNSNVKKDVDIRDYLVGIKLYFTNDVSTPLFHVKDHYENKNLEFETQKFDKNKDLRKI